jgi:hypothetical protein
MRGSKQRVARQDRGRVRAWFSRIREQLAVSVLGGLLVLALPASVGLVLGAGTAVVIGAAISSVVVVAFAAGAVYGRGPERSEDGKGVSPPATAPPAPGVPADHRLNTGPDDIPGVAEIEKLLNYMDYFAVASQHLQLGQLEELELELLSRPARLMEQENGGTVQLAIFVPAEVKDREPYWRLPYVARISPSECRELEVPLRGSQLARSQESWEPGEEVMVVADVQERRWRKLGADFEGFAQAGFRMVRYLPFGPPGADGKRACIVLLSKDLENGFTGVDDFFIMLLGTLLSMHPLLSERARRHSEERKSSE